MNPLAHIIVQNGGTLIVDAGSINDGSIEVRPTAALILRNAGTIHLKKRGDLKVYIGGHAYLVNGNVLPYE